MLRVIALTVALLVLFTVPAPAAEAAGPTAANAPPQPLWQAPNPVIPIDTDSQLFVDDYLIAYKRYVLRQLNQPVKRGEPLTVSHPEGEAPPWLRGTYGSVIDDGERLRLYYMRGGLALAYSTDGVHFDNGPIEGAARPGTNVVLSPGSLGCCGIIYDPLDANPGRRWKLVASRGRNPNWMAGLTPATSPDGIHWTWGKLYSIPYMGDRCSAWYDPVRRRYVAWSRHVLDGGIREDFRADAGLDSNAGRVVDTAKIADMWAHYTRKVFHCESADFETWSEPWLAIEPDPRFDQPRTDFYGAYAFRYGGMYIGYLETYYRAHERLDTQLISSRDGKYWDRVCDGDVFLPRGGPDDFDAYWVVPTFNPPIKRNNKLLIHYNGRSGPHTLPDVRPGGVAGFGLAELREDGFVSLDALGEEGIVETKTLQPPAGSRILEVNACPFRTAPRYAGMRLTVEVFDGDGAFLSRHAAAPPNETTQIWHRFDLERPLPEHVRLRFRMQNCRLYSFRFPQ